MSRTTTAEHSPAGQRTAPSDTRAATPRAPDQYLKRRASQPPGPSREAPDGPGSESLAAEHLRRRVRSELSQPLTGAESHARRDEVTPQPGSGTDTTRNGRVEGTGDSGFHSYPRKVGADLSTDLRKVLPVNNR